MTQTVTNRKSPLGINRNEWLWYFAIPMTLSALMLGMYFSGNRVLENIISAPHFEAVAINSRREFGLLETLQHLLLIAVAVIAARAAIIKPQRFIKAFMAIVALGATFLFLEEIDYGIHYYEYLAGVPHDQTAQTRNIHNVGNRTTYLKTFATTIIILWFGIAPFALATIRNRWIRYLRPPPAMALLLIVMFITRSIAHGLNNRGYGFGLDGNIAEFRELITYYLGLAYTILLVSRDPDSKPNPDTPEPESERHRHHQE